MCMKRGCLTHLTSLKPCIYSRFPSFEPLFSFTGLFFLCCSLLSIVFPSRVYLEPSRSLRRLTLVTTCLLALFSAIKTNYILFIYSLVIIFNSQNIMFPNKSALLLLSLGSLTGLSDAFWRMSCSIIQTSRIDPIVSPGKISSHVHKIAGASSKSFQLLSYHSPENLT